MAVGARCQGDSPVEKGLRQQGPLGAGEDLRPRRGAGLPQGVGRAVMVRYAFRTVTDCVLVTRGKEMEPMRRGGRQWEVGSPELSGCYQELVGVRSGRREPPEVSRVTCSMVLL